MAWNAEVGGRRKAAFSLTSGSSQFRLEGELEVGWGLWLCPCPPIPCSFSKCVYLSPSFTHFPPPHPHPHCNTHTLYTVVGLWLGHSPFGEMRCPPSPFMSAIFLFLVSHWFKSCLSFELGSWGWAGLGPRFEEGGISSLPVILIHPSWGKKWVQYHHAPLLHLLNFARLELGKFFSEIRLSLLLPSPPPNLLQFEERG